MPQPKHTKPLTSFEMLPTFFLSFKAVTHNKESLTEQKVFFSYKKCATLYTFSIVSRSLKTALAIQNLILSYIEVTFKQASVALGCKLYFLIKY